MTLMNALHPAYTIVATVLAFVCTYVATYKKATPLSGGRFKTIDGLRGYLAFFVFLHHSAIWFFYLRTGVWREPASHLYTQLGQASVSMFFMITSFLFYTKLLDKHGEQINWPEFFLSRFLRLTPLYLFAMILMFGIVAIVSDWTMQVSPAYLARCLIEWLSFTALGAPQINNVESAIIVAGVTWSLPYEWYFYLAMPLLSITVGIRTPWNMIFISLAVIAFACTRQLSTHFVFVFAGGIFAAIVARRDWFKRFSETTVASCLVTGLIGMLMWFPTAYGGWQLFIVTAVFSMIAAGTDVFGILSCITSRRLGDLAYSIYLMHGILLFVGIKLVIGSNVVADMSPSMYWLLICAIVPLLLGTCFMTFRYIEMPGMQLAKSRRLWRRGHDQLTSQMLVPIDAQPDEFETSANAA